MKKILILSLLCFSFVARANDDGLIVRNQMLDATLERLTAERDRKYEALKQCEKTTDNFKIAGLTTLIATGFGVYGNIKLYQKYHKGASSGGGSDGNVPPPPTPQKNLMDLCAQFPEDC